MQKSWMKLKVEIDSLYLEAVSNFLIEQGSPGVIQEQNPGKRYPKRERVTAYFPNDRSFEARNAKVITFLRSICRPRRSFNLQVQVIRDENWAEAWKTNFKPVQVTARIIVKPPWEEYPAKKGEVVITIDPGMAFGTGTHPSTQMCLVALEDLISFFPDPPSVLDAGTGSGILAIAARKFGAKKVLAVDIDPVAIACARRNAGMNQVDSQVHFRIGPVRRLHRTFDIVVANLLPQELLEVAVPLSKLVSGAGALIISGFLRTQKKEIYSAFAKQSLKKLHSRESKGWACLVMGRNRSEKEREK